MILCESARRSFQHEEVAIQTFCFMKCRIDTFNVGWPVRRSRDRADHQRPGVRWQTVAAVREHNLLNLGAGPWLVARTKQIWRLFKSHKSVKIQRFQPKLIMSNCPPITQRNGPKVRFSSAIQYNIFSQILACPNQNGVLALWPSKHRSTWVCWCRPNNLYHGLQCRVATS